MAMHWPHEKDDRFLSADFVVSPPDHPIMTSVVSQVYENCIQWHKERGNFNNMYATGSVLLNRVVTGTYSIVPYPFLKELNIVRQVSSKDEELTAPVSNIYTR